MGRVAGKVVLITGAGGGQGAAEALALAREGATVIATDLEAPELAAVGERSDGAIVSRALDVTSAEDWRDTVTWAQRELGRIDGLVNNAGIPFRARLREITLPDFEHVLAVNLTGALLGIQAVVPAMGAGGSIVNVSSAAGLTGYHAVGYTVSKWGLRGLSKVASMELGPDGIRVNTIFPGFIETPMTAMAPEAFRGANVAETPLGRTATADEVAPLVVFLISDLCRYRDYADIVFVARLKGPCLLGI